MNSNVPVPESENESRYEVDSRREIVSILRGLRDRNQLVSMIIDNGDEVIITAILEVDNENNFFVLDRPSTEGATQRVTKAPRIFFETRLDKIGIRFSSSGVTLREFQGSPALFCVIPLSLNRLQRREYYRIAIPLSLPVTCMVPLSEEVGGGVVHLPVIDISCRGVLVSDEKQILNVELGTTYSNCELNLPGAAPLNVILQIRNSYDLVLRNNKINRRIGCELIGLSQKMSSQIQKFITKLERELNARKTGLG